MTTDHVLAIDAGQTEMKVRVLRGDRTHDLRFPGIRTNEPLNPQLAAVVTATTDKLGAAPPRLLAGVSGLTATAADPHDLLRSLPALRSVVLAHDSTTSYLGARGAAEGAVIAAGTGVVTLAVGSSRVSRVDGWGHIMGDAGSGYWIGRAALDAVMRQYDGRGPETSLTTAVTQRWPALADAYIQLQADPHRVRVVASYAAVVAEHARMGDIVSQQISDQAAAELASSAVAALRVATDGDHAGHGVCALGGVFGSERIRSAFTAAIGRAGGTVTEPIGTGIDGVVTLGTLPEAHPLSALIHRADARQARAAD